MNPASAAGAVLMLLGLYSLIVFLVRTTAQAILRRGEGHPETE
jgi:hypothetical protein